MTPSALHAEWIVGRPDPERVDLLGTELGVSRVLAAVLVGRGMTGPQEARAFLSAGGDLPDPMAMADMGRAVERIERAIRQAEPVVVYGDYDADGLTGMALLVDCLRRRGANVEYYVPDRLEEGYGLKGTVLRDLAARGTRLVVTVDCGITAIAEAELAAELGMDLVITDHHAPGPCAPPAFAVLNPLREGCDYPFKQLAGVGVALKLAQAMLPGGEWEEHLDLAAVGTIADAVPLLGENRLLVRRGLVALRDTSRPGLRQLLAASGRTSGEVTAERVVYGLGPRLNAAGRVGRAEVAAEILLTRDDGRARALAGQLEEFNRTRRSLEAQIVREAGDMVAAGAGGACLVLARAGWPTGVLGIGAARLVERHRLPAVLLTIEGGKARGSARGLPGLDILDALRACHDLLETYGGHPGAAGLSLEADRVPEFAGRMQEVVGGRLTPGGRMPRMIVDTEVAVGELDGQLLRDLELLEPCGQGNPPPLLVLRGAPVVDCRAVGQDGAHLRLTLGRGAGSLRAMAFRMGGSLNRLAGAPRLDLAFTPLVERWNGRESLTLAVRDFDIPGGDRRELTDGSGS
ncbi:MAG TPA: single-stranded-DNA-specific exonuclease RecJ [Bacillota bacterium]|nr:single-stranded-DNA-specific exonuclease RecJ [Bacillota bacterium]